MLKKLFVQNFLLIERANVTLSSGLIAITGETGSGKSLFIKALSSLMGESLSVDLLRDPARECVISGTFFLPDSAQAIVRERGVSLEEGQLIIRRTLSPSGTSSFYLNDQSVTLTLIKELSSLLFERHGQHAMQALLKPGSYRVFLDNYARLSSQANTFTQNYKDFVAKKDAYDLWLKETLERQASREHLEKLWREIEEVAPKAGEEDELVRALEQTQNSEQLDRALGEIQRGFYEGDCSGSVINTLARLRALGEDLRKEGAELEDLATRLKNVYFEVEDIAETYKQRFSNLSYQPHIREAQQARLFALTRLRKKLQMGTLDEVLAYQEELQTFLDEGDTLEEEQKKRKEALTQDYKVLLTAAQAISRERHAHKTKLEEQVNAILLELEMKGVTFKVGLESRKTMSDKGIDKVVFSLMQGGKVKPLAEVASGGELSRVMLALKALSLESQESICVIFDEIDTGLGGRAGVSLGRYLYKISEKTQVFVITHLATVAAFADEHLQLKKEVQGSTVRSYVEFLFHEDARVEEFARMMSGDVYVNSLAHASELLARSNQEKEGRTTWPS